MGADGPARLGATDASATVTPTAARTDVAGHATTARLDELLAHAIAAAGPGLEGLPDDPGAHLELVARTDRAHRRTVEMLRAAVLAARAAGHSWDAIGGALGTTRQAAQQRFGRVADAPEADRGQRRTRLVSGLTAFNEMAALALAGRYGWRSVEFGFYYHLLEKDDVQWEHRRLVAWSQERTGLTERGWEKIGGGWFPWVYYARRLEAPALEGDVSDAELLEAAPR